MSVDYKIYVMGGLSIVEAHGELISFSSRKSEAIIVYVIFSEKASCEREELATLFWEDMPEQNALTNLRVTLANIKKTAPDLLSISRRRVSLNADVGLWVDGLQLFQLVEALNAQDHVPQAIPLEKAKIIAQELSLYKGSFLEGFYIRGVVAFEDWITFKRESLKIGVIDAIPLALDALYKNGEFADAIALANRLLFIEPFHEAGYHWLIRLYAADGQREAAVGTYDRYRKMVQTELRMAPDVAIDDLIEQIKNGEFEPVTFRDFAQQPVDMPIPNNIPLQVTSFFGRKSELEQLRGHLCNQQLRLVTMVGHGGIGKTRLAVQAARQNIQLFPDGVWFVPLEGVMSPDLVLPEIYKHLKIDYPEKSQAIQRLVDFLNGHRVMLVLDNFEHVLGASGVISEVIHRTQNSKILVTSREMTGLPEEVTMSIEGLKTRTGAEPSSHPMGSKEELSPAAALFLERAVRIQPDLEPRAEDIEVIEQICELVAGFPLGIELAAAGVKKYTLQELYDHIAEDFSFLKSDQPNLPERQRSLISVFNTFWEQLSDEERLLLSRLSVFRGVVTQNAAKKVAGASMFFLSSLVSRGLLQRVMPKGFRSHSMHRRYVYEKLKENPQEYLATHEKHRDYYYSMLKHLEKEIRDNPNKELLDEIEFELNNIRAAVAYTIDQKNEQKALEFCELLMPFWKIRGYFQEGYHWLNQVFELDTNANQVMKASALCAASKLVSILGDYEEAERFSASSLKIAEKLGDQHGVARALNSLGAAASAKGAFNQAGKYFRQSLDIYRNLRVQQAIAGTLVNIAVMEMENNNFEYARDLLDEAVITFRTVGDAIGIVHTLQAYARLDLINNRLPEAFGYLIEALKKSWELNARNELVRTYLLLSEYHCLRGEWEGSARLLALVDSVTRLHNFSLRPSDQQDYKKIQTFIGAHMNDEEVQKAFRVAEERGEIGIIGDYLN